MTLDFRILGALEVWSDGQQVDIGGPRQRRLLGALLLADGRPIPADRLVDIVWLGDPPDRARNTLRTYVARARRALEASGPAPLVTDSTGWVLQREQESLDSSRFESLLATARSMSADPIAALAALEDALGLWRGDALVEFSGEEWCAGAATRLNELRLVAEEERFDAMLGCGLFDDVIGELERFVNQHPLRDRPRGQQMIALYRAGRQVEAVRHYQEYRRYLDEEIGVEPSDELRNLELLIVNRDPSLNQQAVAQRQLRGFRLGPQIGEGAFGRIYRATQPTLGREVAIKVVRPDLADAPEFIRRFDAEAQFIARLEHPHIVPLFDYWREPGGAYLVMRYLRGGNATQLLQSNGPLSLDRVGRIVDEIGSALAAAHAQGVVHCDLKPANILFDDDGGAYLGDFGIATDIGTSNTLEADPLDSVIYLSPEQASGGVAAPGTDVYAFGAVLFELLTGKAPFGRETSIPAVMEDKRGGRTPALTEFRPELPDALDGLIRRAMQPDPTDRYSDVVEMVVAFHRAADPSAENRLAPPPGLRRPNPYKGLAAFDEADASNFFGRDELVERLEQRVAASRFVAIVGPSGSGKSSAVRAGLAPRLRNAGAFVVSMTPGAHPLEELTRSLLRITPESRENAARRALRLGDEGLIDAAALSLPSSDAQLVVIVDQFEEVFTLASHDEREQFLRLISAAAASDRVHLRVVATIRADFYDRPLSNRVISELVEVNTVPVTPLTPAELERAITGPAERAGVTVEPGLVAALVADAAGSPASLPLVQYVLTELFDHREGHLLETESYHRRGGLSGAIARRADEIFEQCDDDARDGVRRLFSRLVVPGEGTEDTRRRIRRSEVATVPAEVIESYGAARLLTFDHDPTTREPTVEVAHEALIREWPRLRAWLDADRDGLRLLRHVSAASAAWVESDRDPGELYRGGRLEGLEDWLALNPDMLNEFELEFCEASRAARDAEAAERQERYDDQLRSNRRLRRLLAGVGAFAVLALVAGLLALQQRQRADDEAAEAEFERLVAVASALPAQDLQLAMLAAVEAFDMRDGPESRGVLQQALMTEPRFSARRQTIEETGPPTKGPDGEWLFVTEVVRGEEASSGTWYDAATFEPIASLRVDDRWNLRSSPNRSLVAGTFLDRSFDAEDDRRLFEVRVYDPEGREVATLDTIGRPTAVRFIDEDRLAVNDARGLQIWDVRTFDIQQTIDLRGSVVESIEVNADGSLLLVSSTDFTTPTARLVDLDDGEVVPGTFTRCEGKCPVRFAPSGEVVAIGGRGGAEGAVIRRTDSWDVVATIVAPDQRIESLDFSEDGSTLYAGTFEGQLAFYDARTGRRSAPSIDTRAPGATGGLMTAPAGHVITVSSPGVIQRWSVDLAGPFGMWLGSTRGAGVFSPDGSRFLRTNDPQDGWITVYDPATGDMVEAHELGQRTVGGIAFSPDGQRVAVNAVGPQGEVAIYDAETLVPTGEVLSGQGLVFLQFSPDGERLALGANFTPTALFSAHVWNIDSGDVIPFELTADFDGAGRPTWSPDGTRVALADLFGGEAVFDAATGAQVGSRFSVRGQAQAHDVLWEPVGDSLLGIGVTGLSRWDVTTGERTSPFTDSDPGDWMDLAEGGRLLATASRDGEARLWDLVAEEPLGVPFPNPGLDPVQVEDLTFAPFPALSDDGRYLAMTGLDGSVLWTLDPQLWRERACELAGRNMTENEWENVMGDVPYRITCDRWSGGDPTMARIAGPVESDPSAPHDSCPASPRCILDDRVNGDP